MIEMTAMRVQREPSNMGATIGALYVNDEFVCWTLEDTIREPAVGPLNIAAVDWVKSWKVPGRTAVPAGHYDIVLEWSPRFQKVLPELKGVPGFSETKFHAGNRHEDTDGCILVGEGRSNNIVTQSRLALDQVMARLQGSSAAPIFLDIFNPPGRHFQHPASTTRLA